MTLLNNWRKRFWNKICRQYGLPFYVVYRESEKKIAYLEVPKAGCSTIKTQIFRRARKRHDIKAIHLTKYYETHVYYSEKELVKSLQGYFVFTVIRDPIERFVSAYNDKIIKRTTLDGQSTEEASLKFVKKHIKDAENIDAFIAALKPRNITHNRHFRPQSLMLPKDLSIFDHIGTLENMSETFSILEQSLSESLNEAVWNATKLFLKEKQRPAKPESIQKLKTLYQKDYDLLSNFYGQES